MLAFPPSRPLLYAGRSLTLLDPPSRSYHGYLNTADSHKSLLIEYGEQNYHYYAFHSDVAAKNARYE
jgi:hypothetical protein